RKPTERPMRSASSFRVTFLCLRRSWIRTASAAISSCLSIVRSRSSEMIPQAIPGLADGFQWSRQAFAKREVGIAQLLVQRQFVAIAEDGIADRTRSRQGRQHAMTGETL